MRRTKPPQWLEEKTRKRMEGSLWEDLGSLLDAWGTSLTSRLVLAQALAEEGIDPGFERWLSLAQEPIGVEVPAEIAESFFEEFSQKVLQGGNPKEAEAYFGVLRSKLVAHAFISRLCECIDRYQSLMAIWEGCLTDEERRLFGNQARMTEWDKFEVFWAKRQERLEDQRQR